MRPAAVPRGRCSTADEIDLGRLPVQTCWPDDAGPLITWGLVVTRGPQGVPERAAAPEPRHLPPAGDRPAPGDHALAGPPRRRARLPRLRAGAARASRSRSRWRSAPTRRRCSAPSRRCPTRSRSTSSPACCAAAGPRSPTARSAMPASCCRCRRSAEFVLEGHIPVAAPGFAGTSEHGVAMQGDRRLPARARGPVRRPHRLLQRAGLVPGVRDRPADASARPDLPLDLHRQAARRAGGARRGAERGLRADPAEAVSGDRRLLPAARGLQLPDGDRQHQEAATRATPSA